MAYIVVIPFPAQGHINSLLHLSRGLVSRGFNIIFVHSEHNYRRTIEADQLAGAGAPSDDDHQNGATMSFVSLPDGLDPEDDRSEFGTLCEALLNVFPSKLEALINDFNSKTQDQQITCVLVDIFMSWILEVPQKLGIKTAFLCPTAAAFLHFQLTWPQMQKKGLLDSDGIPVKNEIIQHYPGMPITDIVDLPWYSCGKSDVDRILIFKYIKKSLECLRLSDWWLCNSVLELEPEPFALLPKLCAVGPMISASSHGGQLWSEDLTCLHWLDQQKPKSVIYIAFGSFTIFNADQFCELALGLHLLGRPVLWVVRSDFTADRSKIKFPDGSYNSSNTKVVSWAPQLKVLSHPAVACFVTHCGWNSTMEGVANGVPFLCWPYFGDQPMNKSYICDIWKVGLGVEKNEDGIVTRDEVRSKVEQLLGDKGILEKALRLKDIAFKNTGDGGDSSRTLNSFVEWLWDGETRKKYAGTLEVV